MPKILLRKFSTLLLTPLFSLSLSGCDEPATPGTPSVSPGPAAPAPVRLDTIADGKNLIGSLGKPLFTVVKIRGVFTDMTATGTKENDGRIALKILSVEDVPLTTGPCLDFVSGEKVRTDDGTKLTNESEDAKACVGKQFTGYAYERVNSVGIPVEAFQYEPLIASTSPFLKSEIILLVNAKDAAARAKRLAH